MNTRREVLALLAALAASGTAVADEATSYPDKPIKIIIPGGAGGPTDSLARLIANKLSDVFGQNAIVDTRPGAGQTLGTGIAAKSPPDGYTLLLVAQTTYAINATLYPKLSYDPLKDLKAVIHLAQAPVILLVKPSLPIENVQQLIAYAKERPGKLNYGSGGIGTGPHLAMELLSEMAGLNMVHVPYKGSVPAMNDLLGGRLDLMMINMITGLPLVRSGQLRVLGTAQLSRSPTAPEIPTIAESGVPGFETGGPHMIMAPAATPQPIVVKLNQTLQKILTEPEVRKRLIAEGAAPIANSQEEAQKGLEEDIARWGRVIKRLDLRAN